MLPRIELDRPLVVFDLETTGTNTATDRIVEISILKLGIGASPTPKTTRVNPQIPIPPEATAIHGIGDADVADKPTFARLAAKLAASLDGCDLCGFNILRFDIRLLLAEFQRAGVAFSLDGRRFIDACSIFYKQEQRTLSAAMKFYCNANHEDAHGAEGDVLATVAVLNAMCLRYEELPKTSAGLHDFCRDPTAVDFDGKFTRRADGTIVFAFGNHKAKPVDDVAATHPGYLRWMIGQDFMEDTKLIATDALDKLNRATGHTYTT